MRRARSDYALHVSEDRPRTGSEVPEGKHPERAGETKHDDRNNCSSKTEQNYWLATDVVRQTVPVERGDNLSGVMQRHLPYV